MIDVRPMTAQDLDGVGETTSDAFRELSTRTGHLYTEPDATARERYRRELRGRLLETDPGGQWVAVDGGMVVGVASAIRREGLWGLSLLVVRPPAQGQGVGRRLLDRALETSTGATAALILSSSDPAAIRRYARAGFALAPTLSADGSVRRDRLGSWPPGVHEGGPGDLDLAERVDRAVRGAGRRRDLAFALEQGQRLLVADSGYALLRGPGVQLLAATDPAVAADLLRAALLSLPEGQDAQVHHLTAEQQWALPVLMDARLTLRPDGPLCTRGTVGPLTPYIPSGAYL